MPRNGTPGFAYGAESSPGAGIVGGSLAGGSLAAGSLAGGSLAGGSFAGGWSTGGRSPAGASSSEDGTPSGRPQRSGFRCGFTASSSSEPCPGRFVLVVVSSEPLERSLDSP